MSRLLATQAVALGHHSLQHVPVPYVSALQLHVPLPGVDVEAQVGHDGGHHRISGQHTLVLHIQAAGGHDLVPIDKIAQLIHRQTPVGVPVEGDAHVVVARLHHGGQGVHVGGATAVVDVHPIRVGVDDIGAQLGESVEQPGGGGGGGTVGAVHQNAQAAQSGVDGSLQVVDVVLAGLRGHVAHLADIRAGFHGHVVGAEQDDILDLLLQLIGELEALSVKNFDAVVLKGVVAGRDHNARVRPGVYRHPGYARGGQGAQVQHIRPGGAQPGDQRALEQVSRDTGVLADGHQGLLPWLLVLGQHNGRRQSHLVGQVRVQPGVYHAPDAVRSK